MHTKQFYRLRNVRAGYVLYRALVLQLFLYLFIQPCGIPHIGHAQAACGHNTLGAMACHVWRANLAQPPNSGTEVLILTQ